MVKNSIHEARIQTYFKDAAKDLIRAEGVQVVTARNVAERAGYSYATLYNYFKDIRNLIFSCVEDFMQECHDFVSQGIKGKNPGKERLIAINQNYAKFFVQYPGIFDLLYVEKLSTMASNKSDIRSVENFLYRLTLEDMNILQIDEMSIEIHKFAIHGLLVSYFNRRTVMDYKELMEKIEEITTRIID